MLPRFWTSPKPIEYAVTIDSWCTSNPTWTVLSFIVLTAAWKPK